MFKYYFRILAHLWFPQAEVFSLNMPFFLLRSLQLMAHSAQRSRQVAVVITNHGLVRLLVMHVIGRFQIPWETFWDSTEEEIMATRATREEDPKAMEEGTTTEDEYIYQEEPEEMEMELEEREQNQEREPGRIVKATPQDLALTLKPMEEEVLQ